MRWKSLRKMVAVFSLSIVFAWNLGLAADMPSEKSDACPNCRKSELAAKVSTEKGCDGKCQQAKTPEAKQVVEQKAPPEGKGPMGKSQDKAFITDRDTFHFLLENHKVIQRKVRLLDNGVETITESDNVDVAKKIQEHVPAMYERLKSGKGVRYWDPLFAEAFKHGKKMKMTIENTKSGVKVVETSDEVAVVKIIQAHAEVVSKFVKSGFEEAQKEHPLPVTEKK
jgi:hypothetical protein